MLAVVSTLLTTVNTLLQTVNTLLTTANTLLTTVNTLLPTVNRVLRIYFLMQTSYPVFSFRLSGVRGGLPYRSGFVRWPLVRRAIALYRQVFYIACSVNRAGLLRQLSWIKPIELFRVLGHSKGLCPAF